MMRAYNYAYKQPNGEFSFITESGIIVNDIVYNLQFIDGMTLEQRMAAGIYDVSFIPAPDGSAINGQYYFGDVVENSVVVTQGYVPADEAVCIPVV